MPKKIGSDGVSYGGGMFPDKAGKTGKMIWPGTYTDTNFFYRTPETKG